MGRSEVEPEEARASVGMPWGGFNAGWKKGQNSDYLLKWAGTQ